jgi:hypothetical protein
MASHFSSIGFPITTMEEAEEIANRITPEATPIEVKNGTYLRWAPGSGEELWLLRNRRGATIGLNPHFTGSSSVRIGLVERVERRGESPLDGAFFAWAGVDDDPSDGECQLVFDCPDAASHAGLQLPALATGQIAAFAHSIEVHASQEEFDTSQEQADVPFASQSFFPAGLFADELDTDGDADASTSEAIFTGHVVDSSIRTNSLTNVQYVWAAVETLGGVYDVVVGQDLLSEPPANGAVVMGSFWLSGRLVGEPVEVEAPVEQEAPKRKGLIRRLFG